MITGIVADAKALILLIPEVLTVLMDSPYAVFVAAAVVAMLIKQAKKVAPSKR